jgi:hypothetical protein
VGKDAVPEFSAQTLPVGSAPADRTYQPSPIPVQNQSYLSNEVRTVAIDAIPGATSADVNKGVGQPVYGQSSRELRGRGGGHKGRRGGRKDRIGLAGVGADPRDPVKERGLDLDVPKGMEKLMYHDFAGAEEKLPQGAETVAAERY